MAARPDAIVVGAGVVGCAVTYALVRAGLQVHVLDAGFPAGGTTAAGMGHIVVMDDSEAQFTLTAKSRDLLEAVAVRLTPAAEYDRCGTLWVARNDDELAAAHARQAYYTTRGVAAEVLDSNSLRATEPNLAESLAGALHVPGDVVIYPPALAWWLLDQAVEHGATVQRDVRVGRIDATSVRTHGGGMEAGLVVNAAGAAAPQLTAGLPIVPRKGHLAITDRVAGLCRHQLVELGYLASAHTMSDESIAFNLQPRRTGQLLIGSSRELVGWDASLDRGVLSRMLARAADFVPAIESVPIIRAWTGFRPATPDKLPLIGQWHDGVWIAAGHEGLGIATALGTAELLAALLTGSTLPFDATPFTPTRMMNGVEVHA